MKRSCIFVHVIVAAFLAVNCTYAEMSKPGEPLPDDAAITAKIKASLEHDNLLTSYPIRVETRQGIVRLRGTVDSRKAMDKAASIAQGVDGVKSVRNEIKLINGNR